MKSIKEYIKSYFDKLKADRNDYTSHRPIMGTLTRGLEMVFGALIVIMLLMGNVLEKDILIPFYSTVSFTLFILVFFWMIIKVGGTMFNKRHEATLGLRHDIIKLFTYMMLYFIFCVGFMILVGVGSDVQPETVEITMESFFNLSEVMNWFFGLATLAIGFRGIIFIMLLAEKREELVCDPDVVKDDTEE